MVKKATNDIVRLKCKYCGNFFTPKRSWQKFCNPSHQKAYWKQIQNDKAYLLKRVEKLEEKLDKGIK